jgi:hypothetical protein
MNYTDLREGDNLHMVGVLQHLLNRTGASLVTDGIFGGRTLAAVRAFQKPRGLLPDGVVGENTWTRLTAGVSLPILDSVDIWDPTFLREDAAYIKKAGGNPLLIGGMCNGVEQAVSMILAASPGNVFLLRFHGHGAPGVASVASGRGELDPDSQERADILANPGILHTLSRLSSIFGPYGCVQFMHCQTGRGPEGHQLLSKIARALGVPASAAVTDQYGLGDGNLPFGYTGPTVTAVPSGGTLAGWVRSLPDFTGMSVP